MLVFYHLCHKENGKSSVADPDPEVWDRIRILALINGPIFTFFVCVKAINTLRIVVS
jgi:hypothetical protein